MIKSNLDDGAVLTKIISRYELDKGPELGRIHIDIHEVVHAPNAEFQFLAVPGLIVGKVKGEFIIPGDSETEVLIGCLCRLKGKSMRDVLEENSK